MNRKAAPAGTPRPGAAWLRSAPTRVCLAGALLVLLTLLATSGCQSGSTEVAGQAPTFHFRRESRVHAITFRGTVQASDSAPVSLRSGNWGTIKWLIDEGSLVASGDHLVSIDMSQAEEDLRMREKSLRQAREHLESFQADSPLAREKTDQELTAKGRELALKEQESVWLRQGKSLEERIRAQTDFEKAGQERSFTERVWHLQQQVASRGFDTPFSVRQAEIEFHARDIERDYSKRLLKSLDRGPLAEETAKNAFQVEVASGELWLAKEQVRSASATRAIERKSMDFGVEINAAQVRELSTKLDQREIRAERPGMVVLPMTWMAKASVGMELWEGLNFLTVVGTDSFILDAAIDETLSAMIVSGASATVTLDPFPDRPFPGTVMMVGKVPRRSFARRTSLFKFFPVQLSIACGSAPIRIGTQGTARVLLQSSEGVFLPRDVLHGTDASPTVLLREWSGTRQIPITCESFGPDLVKWLDPPAESGELLFP